MFRPILIFCIPFFSSVAIVNLRRPTCIKVPAGVTRDTVCALAYTYNRHQSLTMLNFIFTSMKEEENIYYVNIINYITLCLLCSFCTFVVGSPKFYFTVYSVLVTYPREIGYSGQTADFSISQCRSISITQLEGISVYYWMYIKVYNTTGQFCHVMSFPPFS